MATVQIESASMYNCPETGADTVYHLPSSSAMVSMLILAPQVLLLVPVLVLVPVLALVQVSAPVLVLVATTSRGGFVSQARRRRVGVITK